VNILVNAKQRTILFLIADTGAGHRSAANAIRNALHLISQQEQDEWLQRSDAEAGSEEKQAPPPHYNVEIVDVFEEYSRFPLREFVKLYGPAIRYNPKLYGDVFHLSNRVGTVTAVNTMTTPLLLNGLKRLIISVQPDIIVSIHPMINHVTIRALRSLGLKIPFLTVVTDLVSVHHFWLAEGADGYILPTEEAKKLYLERGLDPKRMHVLGMPIDPKFSRPIASKEELRQKFGLTPGLPVILLVGGGDGAGGLQTAVKAISQARLPVQLLVVTGRNKRLYANLQRTRTRLHVPAQIFGFVDNMPELMHAADVLITKAGPGTICEALACNLPLILSGYVPGQEEGNVDFVVQNGVGVLALDPRTLVNELRKLIKPGSKVLQQRLENAKALSRPEASFDIARCILSYIPANQEMDPWESPQWLRRQRHLTERLRSAVRLRPLSARFPHTLLKNPATRRSTQTHDLSDISDVWETNKRK
jgi:1,2-diacylglycerol 3-beta-galactosyltransferase